MLDLSPNVKTRVIFNQMIRCKSLKRNCRFALQRTVLKFLLNVRPDGLAINFLDFLLQMKFGAKNIEIYYVILSTK